MADNQITDVPRVTPAYPVRPPQPADKERDSEKRKQQMPKPPRRDEDDDGKHTIDEYV